MSEQSNQPQDEAERIRHGAERLKSGPEDVAEVEGHVRRNGPESHAFGTEGAAEAERRPHGIRPEDDPDPADGRAAQ
jgi:hypothetical protein